MAYSVVGLFIRLAYGSGEDAMRESYPDKLTSLDALVTGRLFSQNVSRAVLIGSAIGGRALALISWAYLPWQGELGYREKFWLFWTFACERLSF